MNGEKMSGSVEGKRTEFSILTGEAFSALLPRINTLVKQNGFPESVKEELYQLAFLSPTDLQDVTAGAMAGFDANPNRERMTMEEKEHVIQRTIAEEVLARMTRHLHSTSASGEDALTEQDIHNFTAAGRRLLAL